MVNYNIYSPRDDIVNYVRPIDFNPNDEEEEKFIELLKNMSQQIDKINIDNAMGSFTYRTMGKSQNYSMRIESIEDAIIIACLLVDRELLEDLNIPDGYIETYELFEHNEMFDSAYVYMFKDNLQKWLKPLKKGYS